MNKKIMAVAAHADDIELNVGGVLSKYLDNGYEVVYVMSTNNFAGCWSKARKDGIVNIERAVPEVIMPQRKLEADTAAKALGTEAIHLDHPQRHYNLPGGAVQELRHGCPDAPGVAPGTPTILTAHEDPEAVNRVKELILNNDPECVMTHGMDQQDMEHLGTAILVTKAYWKAVEEGYQGAMLQWRSGFTFLGYANCGWETFIDISGYLEKKVELVAMHACQFACPYDKSLSFYRRALEWGTACGCRAAEVFTFVQRPAYAALYPALTLELINNSR
jgi:LmbE family N-acetylglucosaminyl deacetylase